VLTWSNVTAFCLGSIVTVILFFAIGTPAQFDPGGHGQGISYMDFNCDGLPDLVTPYQNTSGDHGGNGTYAVYLNTGTGLPTSTRYILPKSKFLVNAMQSLHCFEHWAAKTF
jgi:hypothetical protein